MAAVSAHAEARDILQRLLANPKVRIGDTKNVHRKVAAARIVFSATFALL